MNKPPKRNTLNSKQIHILKLLFKFRYLTAPLLLEYKELNSLAGINRVLKILKDQEYIDRRYSSSYLLQGKAARHYLAPKGLRYLRDTHGFNETVLHSMYKNKTANEAFLDHHLDLVRAFMNISTCYPETFNRYTKYELGGLDYFPASAPGLYLSRVEASEEASNDFMLDIYSNTPLFVLKKRVDQYIEHFEAGDWESETKTSYPTILIACPDSRTEEKLQSYIEKTLDSAGIDDLHIFTATTKSLLSLDLNNLAIWTKPSKPEKTYSLNNM